MGQLESAKGPDLLIQAYQEMHAKDRAKLVLYGDPDKNIKYFTKLKSLANGNPDIEFRGTFLNQDMGKVFTELDVLVVPSRWYDFPLVIPSAQATHTPVIATDLYGMKELVRDGVDGFLFQPNDVNDLAVKMQTLTEDHQILQTLRSGITPVRSMQSMVDEYQAAYMELVRMVQQNSLFSSSENSDMWAEI
jgi:glycosyltransferase involved in cell wall biosynthesis